MSAASLKALKERRRRAFELHLLDEHLVAIGHVAIRAAMLDNLIELTAQQIIKRYSETVSSELAKWPSSKKVALIKEALIADMPAYKNAISEFFSEVWSSRTERNEVLHRTWRTTETPEVKALVEVVHGGPEKFVRRVTAKSMMDLANRTLDLALELGDWKMCANNAQLVRSVASPGRPAPPIVPRPPPRRSPKDHPMPHG